MACYAKFPGDFISYIQEYHKYPVTNFFWTSNRNLCLAKPLNTRLLLTISIKSKKPQTFGRFTSLFHTNVMVPKIENLRVNSCWCLWNTNETLLSRFLRGGEIVERRSKILRGARARKYPYLCLCETHSDGVEEEGPICIFGRKDLSDLWKNTKIQKDLTVRVLGLNCFYA